MVKGSNVKKFKMYSTSTAPSSTFGMDNISNSINITSFHTSNDTLYTNWTTTLSPNSTNDEHKFTKGKALDSGLSLTQTHGPEYSFYVKLSLRCTTA